MRFKNPVIRTVCLACGLLIVRPVAAQFSPPPDGLGPRVPQGTAACSVQKSCADLAPGMMKSAEAPSALADNLHYLSNVIGLRPSGSQQLQKAVAWSSQAFRQIGLDRVYTEQFTIPEGSHSLPMNPAHSANLIAEITGREKPDDFVVVTSHLDSGEKTTATDDCNVAFLIDVARVIQAAGAIPRRSIRFALFSGYYQQMAGSWAYINAHRSQLEHIATAVSFDGCLGRITGYSLGGREDMMGTVHEALEPIRSFGADRLSENVVLPSDIFDFLTEGIPTLSAEYESAARISNENSSDKQNAAIAQLKRQVGIAAITAFAIADAPERIGPRLSRSQIESLLDATGLRTLMRSQGLWKLWASGARGRTPQ